MLGHGPHPCTQFMIGVFLFWGGQARPFLYPGHIGLGNRPQMYSMLGNELNLWIGLFLLWGGQARSFLYPGHIRLGNWPHMLDNGPHSSPWDVLSLGTFFTWEVLYLGRFFPGTFFPQDVLSWDVLYVHQSDKRGTYLQHNVTKKPSLNC